MALILFAFVYFTLCWHKAKENFQDSYAHGLFLAISYYFWELSAMYGIFFFLLGQDKEATISSLGILF
jgi:hypothetical protein